MKTLPFFLLAFVIALLGFALLALAFVVRMVWALP